jgi:hypothetical protein
MLTTVILSEGYEVSGCVVRLNLGMACVLWWTCHNLWSMAATYVVSQITVDEMSVDEHTH